MALFGALAQKKPAFDPQQAAFTPPLQPASMPQLTAPTDTVQPRVGFFGQGGVGRNIAGSIGDFLLQRAGAGPIYAPAMRQQQQMQYMQQQRQDENADWLQRQIWERQNPRPVNNDTTADYEFLRSKLGDEAANAFLRNKTLPPMTAVDVQNPDGSVTRQFYPRAGPTQPSGPAPGTVMGGYRFKGGNPNDRASWEPVGGAGSGQQTFP